MYWSSCDPSKKPEEVDAQTFWEKVPGLDSVIEIVGAQPYAISANKRYIILFGCIHDQGEQKLVFMKYDLAQHKWDEESPNSLKLPNDVRKFKAILVQTQLSDADPPWIVIKDNAANPVAMYLNRLSRDASDWGDEDAQRFRTYSAGDVGDEEFALKDDTFILHIPCAVYQIDAATLLFLTVDHDAYIRSALYRVNGATG